MTRYSCFECHGIFPEDEMKQTEISNNFHVVGHNSNTVDTCPFCNAVAFFGFNKLRGENNEN